MVAEDDKILYVGKAKNLKKRIASYFRTNQNNMKTGVLMRQVVRIEVIVTASENEALLLENTLIKKLKPKYNILFKDDKSYPYLFMSEHQFPRLSLQRGPQNRPGDYYGPYPSAAAAHETLHILQKFFLLRSCNEVFFRNRTRPCVQYQIKRCSAPCVGYIDINAYHHNVDCVKKFLGGKSKDVIQGLKKEMQNYAVNLDYEAAANLRNIIESLQKVYEQQYVVGRDGDVDAVALVTHTDYACIQILFVRGGKVVGNKSYPFKLYKITEQEAILASFLAQYYLANPIPKRILLNKQLTDRSWLAAALSERQQRKVDISDNVRGKNRHWLQMAQTNAEQALAIYLANKNTFTKSLQDLKAMFALPKLPQRIECFDISHTAGEATIASCVVFDKNGPSKNDYRRFNIENVAKSDDYAAIKQALQRRYKAHELPDVVLIDGGRGQLTIAKSVLKNKDVVLLAIAKGPTRKPGLEVIYSTTLDKPISLPENSSVLHLLQRIRDEAHRFAITGHRQKRAKIKIASILETIPGVGPKKRQALLKHFAGIQNIKSASVAELSKASGINLSLAQRIYEVLHHNPSCPT